MQKKLLRTTKKEYFNNLDTKKSLTIERFGELLFLFWNKNSKNYKIIPNEDGKTILTGKKNYVEYIILGI